MLALCAKAGLVSVGVVAVDGTAIAANASREATRTYGAIREEVDRILQEADAVDRAEDAEHGRKLGGRKPAPLDPDRLAKKSINITDPGSRVIVRAGKPAVQGYNAQAVASADQIILAADLTQQVNDGGLPGPMINAARDTLQAAGIDKAPETVLADGGYWSSPQIAALGRDGLEVIVPAKSSTRTASRRLRPKRGPEAQRIQALLDTPAGAAKYRQRQHIIETVFARTKVPARDHEVSPSRARGLPRRVATDRHRPQPPQAPHRSDRLRHPRRQATSPAPNGPPTGWPQTTKPASAGFAQQPQIAGLRREWS